MEYMPRVSSRSNNNYAFHGRMALDLGNSPYAKLRWGCGNSIGTTSTTDRGCPSYGAAIVPESISNRQNEQNARHFIVVPTADIFWLHGDENPQG